MCIRILPGETDEHSFHFILFHFFLSGETRTRSYSPRRKGREVQPFNLVDSFQSRHSRLPCTSNLVDVKLIFPNVLIALFPLRIVVTNDEIL